MTLDSRQQPEHQLREHCRRLDADGFTIVEGAFDPALGQALIDAVDRLETDHGIEPAANAFEGARTWRIYNLLARDRVFTEIPTNPLILPLVEHVLDPGCLVSSLSSIVIGPGEEAQPLHADDQVMPLPRPHPATVCNSMWALTDFTEANGATRIVPGSHRQPGLPPYGRASEQTIDGAPIETVAAEMRAGSVLVWNGSLWHGGGANRSDARRYGIAMNYCAGWIRQQENQQLGIPLEVVGTFEPRLQQLCGFATYRHLMGHIDRRSPAEVLLGSDPAPIIWDVI